MLLELIVVIFTAGLNLALGVYTWLQNRKSWTHIFLFQLTIIIALWSVANYFSLHSSTTQLTLWWIRIVMFVTTPLGPTVFLLTTTFPSDKLLLDKKWTIPMAIFGFIVAAMALSPYMFTSVEFIGDNIKANPGPAIVLFAINFAGLSILGFIMLVRKFLRSEGKEKQQIYYFLLGIVLTFSLIIAIFLITILFKTSLVITFGPLTTLILVGFISYAIVQHGLFDVKIIATQAFTVILWMILFARLFAASTLQQVVVDSFVLIIVMGFGLLLVRSVQREVSQRKKLEELTERLKELGARKDEFISVAAHELRAPMTAIKGYLSMVEEGDAGKITPKVLEFLGSAGNANERLIRLVNNMLDVARIEEGRQTFEMGTVSLSEVAKEAVVSFENLAKEKSLAFSLEIPESIKDTIEVDKDRIHEVVTNLVSNAIKYTDKGSVILRLKNSVPSTVYFEVVDTGAGLSSEEQQKLFTKFYRAESNTGKAMGSGLGLYVSKLLIEKFGGKIGVVSQRSVGSTFWFELPLKE